VSEQAGPGYRDAAETVKSRIASGRLSGILTIPEAKALTGTKYATARKAMDLLVAEGILEGRPGKGFQVMVTAEEAAAACPDNRPVRDQIAELQRQMGEVRERLGRMEASLATLTGKPRGGRREQADAAARSGRR
jgi:DNA-binding GntR family transcriptional regulator